MKEDNVWWRCCFNGTKLETGEGLLQNRLWAGVISVFSSVIGIWLAGWLALVFRKLTNPAIFQAPPTPQRTFYLALDFRGRITSINFIMHRCHSLGNDVLSISDEGCIGERIQPSISSSVDRYLSLENDVLSVSDEGCIGKRIQPSISSSIHRFLSLETDVLCVSVEGCISVTNLKYL